MTWILVLLRPLWDKIILVGTAVLAVFLLVARIKKLGREEERQSQKNDVLEIKQAQQKAAAKSPKGKNDLLKRIRGAGL